MILSDIQSLTPAQKLQWLKSPEGLAQLKSWLASGLSLKKIVGELHIHETTLYNWCESDPVLSEISGRPLGGPPDLSRPPAYRLLVEYKLGQKRGYIASEYETAEDVWQSYFINSYFSSYGWNKMDYYDDYLSRIRSTGIYCISRMYTIAYCEVDKKGLIHILKPT